MAVTMIGKMGAAAGFGMVFQYSAEAFPTVLRNTSVGSGSVFARVGSISAPFIYLIVSDMIRHLYLIKYSFHFLL